MEVCSVFLGIDIGTSSVKALLVDGAAAADSVKEGKFSRLREDRYRGWSRELGRRIESGEFTLDSLADHALESGLNPEPQSGRQELAESLIARQAKY